MKFGITVNIGNYNSLRCESSDHETLQECYEEVYEIMGDWDDEFDSVVWWKKKILSKIKKEVE